MTDTTKSEYIVGQCAKNASFTIHIEGATETDRQLVKNIIKQLELYIEMLPNPDALTANRLAAQQMNYIIQPHLYTEYDKGWVKDKNGP